MTRILMLFKVYFHVLFEQTVNLNSESIQAKNISATLCYGLKLYCSSN